MASSLRAIGTFLISVLSMAACGGTVLVPDGTSTGGGDGGGGGTGSGGSGGTAPSTCPAAAPAKGAPCKGSVMCSFGSNDCQQAFACVNDHWAAGNLECTTCPASTPTSGTLCASEGTLCQYSDPGCGEAGADATCLGGVWNVTFYGPACAPACPSSPPEDGAPCNACCDTTCSYPAPPGCTPLTATCQSNDIWSVPTVTCLPPEPCLVHANPVACTNDVSCRWLVPGCTDPALPFEGCFPKAECASNGECSPGEICLKCEIDPCWDKGCNACSATTFVCTPPPPP